jgi:hypothetical protein
MTRLLRPLFIIGCWLFTSISIDAQSHPRILVNNDDKTTVLAPIENQAWAKAL